MCSLTIFCSDCVDLCSHSCVCRLSVFQGSRHVFLPRGARTTTDAEHTQGLHLCSFSVFNVFIVFKCASLCRHRFLDGPRWSSVSVFQHHCVFGYFLFYFEGYFSLVSCSDFSPFVTVCCVFTCVGSPVPHMVTGLVLALYNMPHLHEHDDS